MTVGELVERCRAALAAARPSAARDAELLVAEALGWAPASVWTRVQEEAPAEAVGRVSGWLERHRLGEPLAYLFGHQEFYGRRFHVTPAVLIPRPETEHLVEEALARWWDGALVDVGTGSGAVAVSVALECRRLPGRILGTDRSFAALRVARGNALRLGAAKDTAWVRSDLLEGLREVPFLGGVVANLPYVEPHQVARLPRGVQSFEPREALTPQRESPALLRRRLLEQAWPRLRRGGFLALEVGAGQAGLARGDLLEQGYRDVVVRPDLARIGRIVAGVRP